MSTIMRYDKAILTKEFGKLKKVGETFEIGDMTENHIIIRDLKSKIALGAIGIDEFDEYFKVDYKKEWTKWANINDMSGCTIGCYRTNGKRVQVKTENGVRAEAKCHKMDSFNLRTGIAIALNRCYIKYYKSLIKENKEKNKLLKSNIAECNDMINKIISNV